jgi:hypothetical protein
MSQKNLRALQDLIEGATHSTDALRTAQQVNLILMRALTKIATIVGAAQAKAGARTPGTKKRRRSPLKDGSLPHRLVEASKEPRSLPQLVEVGNARKSDVKSAVLQLERDGYIRRVGNGRWTKYQAAA